MKVARHLTVPSERVVSFLGPAGTHSHLAAISIFGPVLQAGFRYRESETLQEVLSAVTEGSAAFGVVPYYNTTSGAVSGVYPALLDMEHSVFRQIEVLACVERRISHDLLGTAEPQFVSTVFSKAEAFAQCLDSLKKIIPDASLNPCASTAEAARLAEKRGPQTAAIASREILRFHPRLRLISPCVQDATVNITRFLVIRHKNGNAWTARGDRGTHTWLLFNSSLRDGVFTRLMGYASYWGLNALPFEGAIVDPETMARRFLLEIPHSSSSLKVQFFLSQIGHLRTQLLATPVASPPLPLEDLRNRLADLTESAVSGGDCEWSLAESWLPFPVQRRLTEVPGARLFVHDPVTSVESVWKILGAEPDRIVNTQVCKTRRTGRVLFCCLPGTRKVDTDKIAVSCGEECARVSMPELKELQQCLGAISFFTAPEAADILVDEGLPNEGILLAGSGHPQISVAVPAARLYRDHDFVFGDFSSRA